VTSAVTAKGIKNMKKKIHFTLNYPFKGTGFEIPVIFQDLFLFFYLQHTQIIWRPNGALMVELTG
jgi:hypothetical protein